MKAVIVIDGLARGGAERQALNAVWALGRRGCDVELLHYHPRGGPESSYTHPALEHGKITYLPKGNHASAFVWRLRAHLKRSGCDVVHAFKDRATPYVALAARLAGTPVVLGGCRAEYRNRGAARSAQRAANLLIDGWIVNAEVVARSLRRSVGARRERCFVVPNGIDPEAFAPRLPPGEARARLGLPREAGVVTMIARLRPQKDHRVFLDMASRLAPEHPGTNFLIVGGGELRADLEREATRRGLAGRVMFMGDRPDVPDILAATDVSVLASHYEGLSNALLESMAAGVPVVSTDFPGVEEVLVEGREGLVVPAGNGAALASAVGALLRDPALRRRMGEKGARSVRERFSLEAMSGSLLQVYENCLQSKITGRVAARAHALAIVSSYPPPHGGVSTEVLRLRPILDRRDVDYVVYNTASESSDGERVVAIGLRRRSWWTLRFLLTCRERAVYLMSARLIVWVLGAAILPLRGKRVLVQLRNARLLDLIAHSPWQRAWAGFALRRMARVVCVSRRLVEGVRSLGVDERRVLWCPAFLPPTAAAADRRGVASEVWRFAEQRHPVIAANGKVGFYAGHDLYGLDLLVDLAARLNRDYPSLGIVVCFWDHLPRDDARLAWLRERAAERGVEHAIHFNTRSGTFIPVLQAADLFIRPTNTDGDAVSVREALYLGIPTIASDAVERPEGTILFRNRDLDDLEAKVRAALDPGSSPRPGREPRLSDEDRRRIDAYVNLLAEMAIEN